MSAPTVNKTRKIKIKLNQSLGGNYLDERGQVRAQFAHQPGTVLDWDAEEAARFVERGIASYVEEPRGSAGR